jgi:hypothetical protein
MHKNLLHGRGARAKRLVSLILFLSQRRRTSQEILYKLYDVKEEDIHPLDTSWAVYKMFQRDKAAIIEMDIPIFDEYKYEGGEFTGLKYYWIDKDWAKSYHLILEENNGKRQ